MPQRPADHRRPQPQRKTGRHELHGRGRKEHLSDPPLHPGVHPSGVPLHPGVYPPSNGPGLAWHPGGGEGPQLWPQPVLVGGRPAWLLTDQSPLMTDQGPLLTDRVAAMGDRGPVVMDQVYPLVPELGPVPAKGTAWLRPGDSAAGQDTQQRLPWPADRRLSQPEVGRGRRQRLPTPPDHQNRQKPNWKICKHSERSGSVERPRFIPVTSLEDVQAIRCAEFHPFGKLYAIGSNSKTLRICSYPKLVDLRDDHVTCQPSVVLKRTRHHKGSIYCMAWSPVGDLLATGSNDKTIKLMRFDADACSMEDPAAELSMHDGTVRDLCFIEDMSNKSSLLVSGGAGDCKIYVTDCATGVPFQALSGHTGTVLSLSTWGGAMFVSGSQDRSVRVWDLRSRGCVNRLQPPGLQAASRGSPVASLAVDPSGRLLVSGHEDSSCVLYDLRGDRVIQTFRPHDGDVRSVRFSPHAFYLLTAGYDNRLVLSDLQGDLTMPLPSVVVAQHQDKVITGRWHPYEFSFLSTGADKTCSLWALPPL